LPNDAGAGPATGVTPIPKALIHVIVKKNSRAFLGLLSKTIKSSRFMLVEQSAPTSIPT
jgi:hypothetical protein